MRLLTKEEACREMGVSLSTLNRRIAAGELAVRKEPSGRRHRVYVVLEDDPPGSGNDMPSGGSALAVARERIRGMEAQVALLLEQLEQERQLNIELVNELKEARERRGFWWRFRRRGGGSRALTGQAGDGMMDSKTITYIGNP